MKTILASVSAVALLVSAAHAAATSNIPGEDVDQVTVEQTDTVLFAAKGRGKNGDGKEDSPDDDDDDESGSGRDKPRIPGGSGCDDPGDVNEHPECAG